MSRRRDNLRVLDEDESEDFLMMQANFYHTVCHDHLSGLRDVLSFVVMVSDERFLV